MVAAYHAETGMQTDEAYLTAALAPLLDGTPMGVAYLIGPRRSPVGYIALSFGWSIELGGINGTIDEFWIRPPVRGRGMGMEVLLGLVPALAGHGLCGLTLEMDRHNTRAHKLYNRAGFHLRETHSLMTRVLR